MEIDNPALFIEINDTNYIFLAGQYDENQNFKVIEKMITLNSGIEKNKFISIDQANEEIKKNITIIEKKLNFIFKDITVLIDNFYYSSINISGFKRLNGSQVFKENISYILNSLKLAVTESEKQKTILHIFNSKSILDGTRVENLPIGLFGDFYSHELTFFLIGNNDLKNIQKIFNKNNLNIKKILLKSFNDGVQLINNNKDSETFFRIKLDKDSSNISFFNKSSFRFSENFMVILKAKLPSVFLAVPKGLTIHDCFYDRGQNTWTKWEALQTTYNSQFTKGNTVRQNKTPSNHGQESLSWIVAPTQNILRTSWVLPQLVQSRQHVYLAGPSGSGKTSSWKFALSFSQMDSHSTLCTHLHSYSSASQFEKNLRSKLSDRKNCISAPLNGQYLNVIMLKSIKLLIMQQKMPW